MLACNGCYRVIRPFGVCKRRSNNPSLKRPSPTRRHPLLNHRHQLPVAHLAHTPRRGHRHHRNALQRFAPCPVQQRRGGADTGGVRRARIGGDCAQRLNGQGLSQRTQDFICTRSISGRNIALSPRPSSLRRHLCRPNRTAALSGINDVNCLHELR